MYVYVHAACMHVYAYAYTYKKMHIFRHTYIWVCVVTNMQCVHDSWRRTCFTAVLTNREPTPPSSHTRTHANERTNIVQQQVQSATHASNCQHVGGSAGIYSALISTCFSNMRASTRRGCVRAVKSPWFPKKCKLTPFLLRCAHVNRVSLTLRVILTRHVWLCVFTSVLCLCVRVRASVCVCKWCRKFG